MKMLTFELKKLIRQKKFLWLLIIIILYTGSIYYQNINQQSLLKERGIEKLDPILAEVNGINNDLLTRNREGSLREQELLQLRYVQEMEKSLVHWRIALSQGAWENIPKHEGDFLENLILYEQYGGQINTISGMDREISIEKNTWLRKHNLSYEDENIPVSPHLILKETTSFLFGLFGIVVMLFLFGSTITSEIEEKTWLTIKTQPISNMKLVMSKYLSLIISSGAFTVMVFIVGIAIPRIFGEHPISLQYPLVIASENSFVIISVYNYVLRAIALFITVNTIIFAITILFNIWLQKSFIALLSTGTVIAVGYFSTELYPWLQSTLNPFQQFHIGKILSEIPSKSDWVYPMTAIFWSTILLTLSVFMPMRDSNKVQSTNQKSPFFGGETKDNSSPQHSIITFEWRKVQREGLLKKTLMFILLITVLGYSFLFQQAQQIESEYIEGIKRGMDTEVNSTIPYHEGRILEYQELLNNLEEDEFYDFYEAVYTNNINNYKKTILSIQESIEKKEKALTYYERGHGMALYEYQLSWLKTINGEVDSVVYDFRDLKNSIGQFTMDVSIAEKKWLIEKEIQDPIFSGAFLKTNQNNWGDNLTGANLATKQRWEAENTRIDSSGLYSLYHLFNQYVYGALLIIFVFLIGGGFASEKGKKPTINFLRTQPIGESKLFLGKIFTSTTITVLSCFIVLLLLLLIGTFIDRLGDWRYPVLHYDSPSVVESPDYTGMVSVGKGFHFVNLGSYLLNSVGIFLVLTMFFMVLSNFISLFVTKRLGVFASTMLIGASGYVLSIQIFDNIAHLSPFTYINIPKITNGEISTMLDNPTINTQTGILVLLFSILVMIVLGCLFLNIGKVSLKRVSLEQSKQM